MKLSFVIPAFNEEGHIGQCLDSIIKELGDGNYDAEIIVVNNASTDRTREMAAERKAIKIVDEPKKGLSWARRAGFLAATGDLIANVDSDTMLIPGWIKKVYEEFSGDPKLLALSGPFIYYDLPPKTRFLIKIFYRIGYFTYLINHYILRSGAMLQGGNYIVKRSALEAIGGYDTNIQFYGEDTDIARRINKIGKVKFTFKLPMYSSGRRLSGEGAFTMGLRYAVNYFWVILFKRPYSKNNSDIRDKDGNIHKPNKIKEWVIASVTALILPAILLVTLFALYKLAQLGLVGVRLFSRTL